MFPSLVYSFKTRSIVPIETITVFMGERVGPSFSGRFRNVLLWLVRIEMVRRDEEEEEEAAWTAVSREQRQSGRTQACGHGENQSLFPPAYAKHESPRRRESDECLPMLGVKSDLSCDSSTTPR